MQPELLSRCTALQNKYGALQMRELENGRVRFYGALSVARRPGDMAAARLVREFCLKTGAMRVWYETVDHLGTVRSVAPKPPKNALNHFIFDAAGNYLGRR